MRKVLPSRSVSRWPIGLGEWLAERAGFPLPGRFMADAPCPIAWQPSVFAPVFYGHRDYTVTLSPVLPPRAVRRGQEEIFGVSVRCRVFFPSLDGAPEYAPILEGCGRYPLILFAHGHCGGDHYLEWYELPALLARCGYVVLVPHLPATGGGTAPADNHAEVALIGQLLRWARRDWEHEAALMPSPATGLIGHSYGGTLTARAASEGDLPIAAHAALSSQHLATLFSPIPKLLAWGSLGNEDLAVPISEWRDNVATPAHVLEFADFGHWDYLPTGRSGCERNRGACSIGWALAADVVACFFGRYLPPERWATISWPPWVPWFRIPPSLRPPPLWLTDEQRFYSGGHFAAWKLIESRPGCGLVLGWKTSSGSGSSLYPETAAQ